MQLYEIIDTPVKNRYCGPAILSSIIGISTGEAAAEIRRIDPYTKLVKGTRTWQIRRVLEEHGYQLRYRYFTAGQTLAQWLKATTAQRTAGRVYLIVAGHHWQLVTGRRYICGRVRACVSIRDERVKRRARVTEVYEVTKDYLTVAKVG